MESSIETSAIITLKMSEKEALWLRSIVQNELHPNESAETGQMRRVFWEAITKVLPAIPIPRYYTTPTPEVKGR